MNEQIKNSIDARKNAILNNYEVPEKFKKEFDEVFSEMEKLGKPCKDSGEFEAKLAASPLNQKYTDLFTKIATAEATANTAKTAAVGVAVGAAETAVKGAIGTAVPTTRAAVNQKVYDAARDIPVVGDAIDVGQKASYIKHLGGLFKKKKS